MTLPDFIDELRHHGTITVAGEPGPLAEEESEAALARLRACYAEDELYQPAPVPAFAPDAALWAARYLYRATQLLLLRELDETAVQEWLPEFAGPATPAAHYSADLLLRHLPDLLTLARALAPADALVQRLLRTLADWPLSAVGAPLAAADPAPVLAHPGLRRQYADRVIGARDLVRARQPGAAEVVAEALGQFAAELWPEFTQLAPPAAAAA